MTFLRGLKANVKPLFAARAYISLVELKSAITNYKQVYEENRETIYDLPIRKCPSTSCKRQEDRCEAARIGQNGRSTLPVLLYRKKGLHAPLVSHTPARIEQELASAVMTYFEDWCYDTALIDQISASRSSYHRSFLKFEASGGYILSNTALARKGLDM
ncbi:hypothetical protein EVAR_94931_1 [Eumeta japonica]|uniref:Uncharacterized protein n=1 Tax=Eumeta variegata TaxID=151549 RepID=A0A4C1Z6K5_EUMVA|nr:hypothetical protein EVAR_94931_1 [Eumeta japonica]